MNIDTFRHFKRLSFWFILLSTLMLAATQNNIVSITGIGHSAEKTSVSLCAKLTQYVYSDNINQKQEYIKLIPNDPHTISLDYSGLCINGLKPRKEYRFTINQQIPLGGYKLDRSYEFLAKTSDFSPSINFKDDGYILPAKGEISIPIQSVNIDKLSIGLYRINQNNLIGQINAYDLARGLSSYNFDEIKNSDGYLLWRKTLKIESTPNITQTTALPIGEHLKERQPGVYILSAQRIDSEGKIVDDYDTATQWFMISDIGLYTLQGDDGLTIYTKHLSTALPYDQVKIELIAKNNEVLATTTTQNGEAHFNANMLKGHDGLQAKAIYAYGENSDFSVLNVSKAPHDLSDRGVGGRESAGEYDAFIYSNRGIFRPSESVPVNILVRNRLSQAKSDVKLSLKLFDSTGTEIMSNALVTDAFGYSTLEIPISQSANRGKWHLRAYAGDASPIGTLSFLVEDFVPPKIKIDFLNTIGNLLPNSKNTLLANVKFLNGTPLAGADVSGDIILQQAKKPFKGYESYIFGDITQPFSNEQLDTFKDITDQNGSVELKINLDNLPTTPQPLMAHITITANEPGGRPVERVLERFIEHLEGYIGILSNFKNSAVDMDSKARFQIVWLKNSQLASRVLDYKVTKENVNWNWSYYNDSWNYQKTYSDAEETKRGTLTTSNTQPSELELEKLNWGSYRLEVSSGSSMLSTYRFTSGYEESISKSSPDRLPIAIDKQSYSLGDTLRVHITPKFSGPAMISIANDKILETKTVELQLGQENEVTFQVDKNWGSSSYVLATAFRAQSDKLGANRAIGVAHISVVNPEQMINLSITNEPKTKSMQETTVTLQAKKANSNEPYSAKAKFTLAAVDEAILRLTDFSAPDPQTYYFGQQKLGIQIRDIYADLIKATGAHAKFNVGAGDDELKEPKYSDEISNKSKVVAWMSQELEFDTNGKAQVKIQIPDYQGLLKLTAVAWSKEAVGFSSGNLIVKDSISPQLYLPRFISVGDSVQSLLNVDFDTDTPSGKYQINFVSENSTQQIAKKSYEFELTGNKLATFKTTVTLTAPTLGDQNLKVEVIKDDTIMNSKEWQLAVRSTYPQTYIRDIGTINEGASINPIDLIDRTKWSDIHDIHLKISGNAILPTASIESELTHYMGTCAEQTTSRAMPWLFLPPNQKQILGVNQQTTIQDAIDRLLNYQKFDGSFGLWSTSNADIWVSSYVLDFLTRADQLGYKVPSKNLNAGLNWLENNLNRWSSIASEQEANAYALYVLTRSGRTLISELLYHANNKNSLIRSASAWGHLASALAFVGEKSLALELFQRAKMSLGDSAKDNYFSNFGGILRDEAALVALMIESQLDIDWLKSYVNLAQSIQKRRYLSTQEMSLALRVAYVTNIKPTPLQVTSQGKPLHLENNEYKLSAATINQLIPITNDGAQKIWFANSYIATPNASGFSQTDNDGFILTKKFYDMQGNEVNLSQIKQNSRIVVVIDGKILNSNISHPLITDWTIAGFELENPNINGVDATTALKWLPNLTPLEHAEYRDDRFEAALDHKQMVDNHFKVAYVVRAVTKGEFILPPTRIEDMYQPYLRAFSTLWLTPLAITTQAISKATTTQESSSTLHKLTANDFTIAYTQDIQDIGNYSIVEVNILRNSILAQAGLDFSQSNPLYHKLFLEYPWYHPTTKNSSEIYSKLNTIQKLNLHKFQDEELKRGDGLYLNDYYRVNNKLLVSDDLKKYSKDQLFTLRNSLFARYGLKFKNDKLNMIFSNMPWYKPTDISSSKIYDELMSEQEKANVQLMIAMQKEAK